LRLDSGSLSNGNHRGDDDEGKNPKSQHRDVM
jgi:hypothetical protein